jgi:hypothetical protein
MKAKLLDILAMLVFGIGLGLLVAEFLTGLDPFYK